MKIWHFILVILPLLTVLRASAHDRGSSFTCSVGNDNELFRENVCILPTESGDSHFSGSVMPVGIPCATTNADKNSSILNTVASPVNTIDKASGTIVLSVTQLEIGVARLDWNPPVPAGAGTHYIQRFENPVWRTIDSLFYATQPASLSYYDTVSYPFCDTTTVQYRIVFREQGTNMLTISNIDDEVFTDRYPPSNPTNDTISLFYDPTGIYTGCPIIGWSPSPEKDVAGYIIYQATPTFIPLDTIPADSTVYLDRSMRGCLQSLTYALAAIDSCGKKSYGTYATAPHTLLLDAGVIDPCERKVHLSWNPYDYMPGGLGGYIIFRQVNNGIFIPADTVSSTTLTYDDSLQFINNYDYTYYIRAFSATGTGSSSSCMVRRTYVGPVTPDTLYISQVSVENDAYVKVDYYYAPASRIKTLLLERSDSPSGPYSAVDTLAASGNSFIPQSYSLTDLTANVHEQPYYYRLTMIDSCNKVALYSENVSNSIFLSCSNAGSKNLLEWNTYGTWWEGTDRYEVYRTVDGTPDPAGPLAVLSSSESDYTDDLNSLKPISQACYTVKAFEATGNPVMPDAFSLSNEACSERDPFVVMPTAFNPQSLNNRFRPVQVYVDPGSFEMQVFNRWGQMIFETNDIYNGWDGYISGKLAPTGAYLYRISYRSFQGENYEKRGVVTLIK